MTVREEIAIVIACCGGDVLVQQRPATDPDLAGLWEFPGGHVLAEERPESGAAREFVEETGLVAPPLEWFHSCEFDYSTGERPRHLRMTFYLANIAPPPPVATTGNWSWQPLATLVEGTVPPANAHVIGMLRRREPQ
ncbi:MAG: NUDIX domain-containing protein [Planctomycetota bacterium]